MNSNSAWCWCKNSKVTSWFRHNWRNEREFSSEVQRATILSTWNSFWVNLQRHNHLHTHAMNSIQITPTRHYCCIRVVLLFPVVLQCWISAMTETVQFVAFKFLLRAGQGWSFESSTRNIFIQSRKKFACITGLFCTLFCETNNSINSYVYNPGRNNGRNFSGIRALTAVKISHRSRY